MALAIELKGAGFDVKDAARQLGGGAKALEHLTAGEARVTFIPLLVHGGFSRIEFRVLSGLRVTYRARDYPISTARCDSEVSVLIQV